MSKKRKNIDTANLMLEQRYLNEKNLIYEGDEPKTSLNLKNIGLNPNDTNVQKTILNQIKQSNKINLDWLDNLVGSSDFFSNLDKVVTLEPDVSGMDKKTITGEDIKISLPNGINLKANVNLGQGGKPSGVDSFGINKNVKINKTPVNLNFTYKNPLESPNISNLRVGAKVTIPNNTSKNNRGHKL